MKLIYLACPFAHPDAGIRSHRAEMASLFAAHIITRNRNLAVFSPLSHGWALHHHMVPDITEHEFWMRQDMPILAACDEIWLLPLDGWRQSRGCAEELHAAAVLRKPVRVITFTPPGYEGVLEDGTDPAEFEERGWPRVYALEAFC